VRDAPDRHIQSVQAVVEQIERQCGDEQRKACEKDDEPRAFDSGTSEILESMHNKGVNMV